METARKRILEFIEKQGIKHADFLEKTGLKKGFLDKSHSDSGASDLNLSKILEAYPEISAEWLLTGKGEMLSTSNRSVENLPVNYSSLSIMLVPLVNQYAYAGYMTGYSDPEYIESLPKVPWVVDREYRGEYVCIEAKGDSMDDGTEFTIKDKDLLLCRNVAKDYWKSKLHINKWDFVIAHRENGIVTKRIKNHDVEKGKLLLHSLNDYYDDYEVDLREVDKIFNVVDLKRDWKRR